MRTGHLESNEANASNRDGHRNGHPSGTRRSMFSPCPSHRTQVAMELDSCPRYTRMFPVWRYLSQPLFDMEQQPLLNPWEFLYAYRIEYLEHCLDLASERSSFQDG
jgi:hypothetical protein